MIIKSAAMVPDTNKVKQFILISRGLLYKDPPVALKFADSAILLAKRISYKVGEAKALVTRAIYYRNNSDYKPGFEDLFAAIKIAESLNDKKIMAYSYNNLGIIYKNQGNYNESVKALTKAKEFYTSLSDSYGIATALGNLSNAYRRDKQFDMALKCSGEAYVIYEKLKDNDGLMSAMAGMAAIYLEEKKDYKMALNLFKREESLIDPNDQSTKSILYYNIATCYMYVKEFSKAFKYLEMSVEAGKNLNNKIQDRDILGVYAELYEATGKIKEALVYQKKFHLLSDSLSKLAFQEATLEMESKFQKDQSEKEIALLSNLNELKNKENEAQKKQISFNRIINILGIIVAIVIASLAFLFYKNFKKANILNTRLTDQNNQIEAQKKEILDSIQYARRIQNSILPQEDELNKCLPNNFVIYKPRNIVSGDFYWTYYVPATGPSKTPISVVAMCDCTGHGVPGAFMSLISYTLLNHIVKHPDTNTPEAVLNFLAKELPEALKSKGHSRDLRDGLDIAVAAIDFHNMTLRCSMAHIPVYICDEKGLRFIAPDKHSISADNYNPDFTFSLNTVQLKKGDRIYFSTDGFADQFGGPKGKKLKYKQLELLLEQTYSLPLAEQKKKLEHFFSEWKGALEQVDDVTLLAVEV